MPKTYFEWIPSWAGNRLHAVRVEQASNANLPQVVKGLCGAYVYEKREAYGKHRCRTCIEKVQKEKL